MNTELFIDLLKKMMKGRAKPVHLVVDGLPTHKKLNVREYIASTRGKLTMPVLPGYAPIILRYTFCRLYFGLLSKNAPVLAKRCADTPTLSAVAVGSGWA